MNDIQLDRLFDTMAEVSTALSAINRIDYNERSPQIESARELLIAERKRIRDTITSRKGATS